VAFDVLRSSLPKTFFTPWMLAGGSPAATHFLLLRQKKVSKEKATLGRCRLRRFPALLGLSGGCGTRAAPSDSPRPFSAQTCVARHLPRGPVNHPYSTSGFHFLAFFPVDRRSQFFGRCLVPRRLSGPLRGAEQRRRGGGSRLALFEPQASSGKPPGLPSSARNPEGAPTQGWLFLWLLSFGHTKESTPARKAAPQACPRESELSSDHIRKIPNRVSSAGAFIEADSPKPSTRRVSAGSIIPSSHSRAEA